MATGNTPAYTLSSAETAIYKKTNTDVMEAIKAFTEEYSWADDTPDIRIISSANEMRLVLDVNYETGVASIPEGGYEAEATSVAAQNGTLTPIQLNARYSFSTLYQDGWNNGQGKQGQIESQVRFQALKKMQAVQERFGQQFYGFTTGTMAVVKTTGGSSTTQTDIALKDPFGTTLIGSTSANQLAYLSGLFRPGEGVALIRSSAIQEFGTVIGAGTSGNGFLNVTFNAAVTPTAGDLIVIANAVTDATLAGTDYNKWVVGLLDATTSASVHGLATSSAPNWASYQDTTGGRWSYAKQQKMINQLMNNGGVTMNRMVMAQGVWRDVVAGEGTALRYGNGDTFDFDWSFKAKQTKIMSSRLSPPGTIFGWNNKVFTKKMLSDKPPAEGGPDIFAVDKVQDRGLVQASLNFVYLRACTNRAGMGAAFSLTEQ
jgi:hypothetical protein